MATDHLNALHELVGAGRSRLSLVGAMRARDVSRPTPEELRAAELRAPATLAARLGGRPRWRPSDLLPAAKAAGLPKPGVGLSPPGADEVP